MDEHKAQKRIRDAVQDSLAWLDELPSQEKEILEKAKKEADSLTTVCSSGKETMNWTVYGSSGNQSRLRERRLGWVLCACTALLVIAGCWAVYRNADLNHQLAPPDVVTQPAGSGGTLVGPDQEDLPAAVAAKEKQEDSVQPLDRIDLYVDPDALWNNETGILAEGDQIEKTLLPFENSVYRRSYENGVTAEGELVYQDGRGNVLFRDEIRLSLGGDSFSMDMPQKSLRIDALDGSFAYPLFDDRSATAYPSILLRNAGNDCLFTRVADGVQNRLIEKYTDTDLLTLAWKPVNVYINDEYFGIFNMRESMDAYTICRYEQTKQAGSITILGIDGSVKQGSPSEYTKMLEWIKNSNPAENPEDLAYLEQEIDIDSFLDWLAVEIYFGNSDTTTGIVYQVNGEKWKCLLQDLDYGLFAYNYDSVSAYLKETGMGEAGIDNSIFRKILEVDQYRDLFLQKIGRLYRTLTTEVMQQELDLCVSWIEPDMKAHLERWAPYNDGTIVAEAPSDPEEAWDYWKMRINRLRNFMMVDRPQYVYQYIQEFFGLSDQEMAVYTEVKTARAPGSFTLPDGLTVEIQMVEVTADRVYLDTKISRPGSDEPLSVEEWDHWRIAVLTDDMEVLHSYASDIQRPGDSSYLEYTDNLRIEGPVDRVILIPVTAEEYSAIMKNQAVLTDEQKANSIIVDVK